MDRHYEEHRAAYGEMLDLLDSNGEPPSYPPWDGWFHPSVHNWDRIRMLRFLELQQNICSRESPHWLHIGEAHIMTNLVFGPQPPLLLVNLPSSSVLDEDHPMGEPALGTKEELSVAEPGNGEELPSSTSQGVPTSVTILTEQLVELNVGMDYDTLPETVERTSALPDAPVFVNATNSAPVQQ